MVRYEQNIRDYKFSGHALHRRMRRFPYEPEPGSTGVSAVAKDVEHRRSVNGFIQAIGVLTIQGDTAVLDGSAITPLAEMMNEMFSQMDELAQAGMKFFMRSGRHMKLERGIERNATSRTSA